MICAGGRFARQALALAYRCDALAIAAPGPWVTSGSPVEVDAAQAPQSNEHERQSSPKSHQPSPQLGAQLPQSKGQNRQSSPKSHDPSPHLGPQEPQSLGQEPQPSPGSHVPSPQSPPGQAPQSAGHDPHVSSPALQTPSPHTGRAGQTPQSAGHDPHVSSPALQIPSPHTGRAGQAPQSAGHDAQVSCWQIPSPHTGSGVMSRLKGPALPARPATAMTMVCGLVDVSRNVAASPLCAT